MFSSVGQIVGLIEIEPASSTIDLLELAADCDPGDSDASLADLLAQLVGRPAGDPCPAGQTAAAQIPGSRIQAAQRSKSDRLNPTPGRTVPAIVLDADLDRLAADLAEEACRLRLRLAAAGAPALRR